MIVPRTHSSLTFMPAILAAFVLVAFEGSAVAGAEVMSFTCKDLKGESFAHDGTTATSMSDGIDKVSVKTTLYDDSSALIEFVPLPGAAKGRTRSTASGTVLNAGIVANIPAHISVAWKETDLETWMVTYYPLFGGAAFTTHKLMSDGKNAFVRVYQMFGNCSAAGAKSNPVKGNTSGRATSPPPQRAMKPVAGDRGVVVATAKDETFVIELAGGKAVFKARTYCFNVNEGDEVVFTKNPSVCTSNTFVDKQTRKTCDVWCE